MNTHQSGGPIPTLFLFDFFGYGNRRGSRPSINSFYISKDWVILEVKFS